jgi:hypothetical protein
VLAHDAHDRLARPIRHLGAPVDDARHRRRGDAREIGDLADRQAGASVAVVERVHGRRLNHIMKRFIKA